MTTSLAMLPPPPIHAHSTATASEPLSPRRPKLSVNTQQIRTFGKGSSLRLETLSAVSPTARNTFSNAYQAPRSEPASTTAPSRPRLSLISSLDVRPRSAPPTPIQLEASTPNSASTASATSASSTESTESATIRIPYKLAHNLPSILSNSPIAEVRTRRMASSSRPLFPATKRVSFRTPLDEEIVTVRYTMAHSDITPDASQPSESESSSLSSSTVSSISTSSSELSSSPPAAAASLSADVPRSHSPPEPSSSPDLSTSDDESNTSSPRTGEKRESPSSSEPDSDSDSCPETPVAGRRKRRREWVWTLGPIGKSLTDSGAAADDDEEEEEDS
ncbi:hypothetical protein W97_07188 [Coniosporium apollinis CBS 100218]|uniref:Uncharacterized protein n=1 Tax=Coniosporium apollinis (strain CBS 100218) TaxID=1168221 RepID=R7Z1H6_CONA1|nr:uncharacterized protein W97_07188 [Coniosporium apollinis CBS 100218]EON68040.1 hypothetical protein W97_07188 [Coniosporium apollinis CBS 100218]